MSQSAFSREQAILNASGPKRQGKSDTLLAPKITSRSSSEGKPRLHWVESGIELPQFRGIKAHQACGHSSRTSSSAALSILPHRDGLFLL